jgi:putative membrane protein
VHQDPHGPRPEGGGPARAARGHRARLVAVAVVVALLAWFALANLRRVRIDFWVFSRDAPLILVIVISGLLGALITYLAMRRSPRSGRAPDRRAPEG